MNRKRSRRSDAARRIAHMVGAAFVAAALTGCSTSSHDVRPAVGLPPSWTFSQKGDASTPPMIAEWWKSFNDPTLDILVARVIGGNLDIATARSRVVEARAALRQAGGELLPTSSGSSSAARGRSGGLTGDTIRIGIESSWEIDLFGANRHGVDAARAGLNAAEEELRATTLSLVGDIASTYVTARGYQAREALAKRNAGAQRETLKLTLGKRNAGAGTNLDVANAEAQTFTTEAAVPRLAASYFQTVNRLSVLTGEAPGALGNLLEKGRGNVPNARADMRAGVPADLLNDRPDVRAAQYRLAQSTARRKVADARRLPSVTLTGNISTSAADFGDLAKMSSVGWGFGPSLTVPIFNAGKLKASAEIAKAQEDQAFIAYRAAVLTALEDVENSSVSMTHQRRANAKLASSVGSYRLVTAMSRTLYREGATPFTEVLNSERSLYAAEDSLIQGRVALANDFIALNKALGGGWNSSRTQD